MRHTFVGDEAQQLLSWTPRPFEDAVIATAQSLLRLGLVSS
jgi:dihydroflavonol-4-reductase